jgi:hypothetical protein
MPLCLALPELLRARLSLPELRLGSRSSDRYSYAHDYLNLRMKLSVNLVDRGRFYRASEELPTDFELPAHLVALVVNEENEPLAQSAPVPPKPPKRGASTTKSF